MSLSQPQGHAAVGTFAKARQAFSGRKVREISMASQLAEAIVGPIAI